MFSEAGRDIKTKTALLESRLIAGTERLYETFAETYRKHYLTDDPKAYIAARLAGMSGARHEGRGSVVEDATPA